MWKIQLKALVWIWMFISLYKMSYKSFEMTESLYVFLCHVSSVAVRIAMLSFGQSTTLALTEIYQWLLNCTFLICMVPRSWSPLILICDFVFSYPVKHLKVNLMAWHENLHHITLMIPNSSSMFYLYGSRCNVNYLMSFHETNINISTWPEL